jgi:hypothetical protein
VKRERAGGREKGRDGDARADDDEDEGGEEDESSSLETYVFAGQTRVRAISALGSGWHGGANGGRRRSATVDDANLDVDVDEDWTARYGPAQYSAADLIPLQEPNSPPSAPPVDPAVVINAATTGSSTPSSAYVCRCHTVFDPRLDQWLTAVMQRSLVVVVVVVVVVVGASAEGARS